MATGRQVASFLQQVSLRNVVDRLPDPDLDALQGFGLLRRFTPAEIDQVRQEVSQLEQARLDLVRDQASRADEARHLDADTRRTHSILFHLHGVDHQHAMLEHLQQEQSALQSLDTDLVKRQQAFSELILKKSLLDLALPYNGGFLAITAAGRTALRDLNVRLYRVGDQEFALYWDASQKTDQELGRIAYQSGSVALPLAGVLPNVERSYVWAVSIGMAKLDGDLAARLQTFLSAYRSVEPLSSNVEDRMMASEIVSALPATSEPFAPTLSGLAHEVRSRGVPAEVALGVGSILLMGRRADGSFAFDPLSLFLQRTRSFESAALLAIENRPIEELAAKFDQLRGQFRQWGYSTSEDTELSSAYLTVSDLPADAISTKLAILARGLGAYLQYPLVAAAILASIPVLEANETLNLLEKAYEILGQRTGPMSQAELISLAVRMIHGLKVASVDELDPTARAAPASLSYVGSPPRIWMPVLITHHVYFATFSGIGGAHPGHVHSWGGGGWGGGGFVG